MSLINDALKRANKSPKRDAPASPLTPLQPVEAKSSGATYLIPGLLVAVLVLAGVFFRMWWSSSHTSTVAPTASKSVVEPRLVKETKPTPTPVVTPAPAPVPVVQTPPAPVPSKYGIKINTNLVTRTNAAVPPPAPVEAAAPAENTPSAATTTVAALTTTPAPPPPAVTEPPKPAPPSPEFPSLKLQGIFFRQSNPSVMINGRTLRTGEKIDGAKVLKIDRESVTVEWLGQTKVLGMELQ